MIPWETVIQTCKLATQFIHKINVADVQVQMFMFVFKCDQMRCELGVLIIFRAVLMLLLSQRIKRNIKLTDFHEPVL